MTFSDYVTYFFIALLTGVLSSQYFRDIYRRACRLSMGECQACEAWYNLWQVFLPFPIATISNLKLTIGTIQTRMDMVSEAIHPMVQKEIIKLDHKLRPKKNIVLPILKVMAITSLPAINLKVKERRVSPLMTVSLLKWLESEFSSSVSSFTGAVNSSYAQRWSDVRIQCTHWINTCRYIRIHNPLRCHYFPPWVFFFKESLFKTTPNMTCEQCRDVWGTWSRISSCLLRVAP